MGFYLSYIGVNRDFLNTYGSAQYLHHLSVKHVKSKETMYETTYNWRDFFPKFHSVHFNPFWYIHVFVFIAIYDLFYYIFYF